MGMIESQLIAVISQNLNFTYEIIVPTDVLELGSPDEKKKNGAWTGVFGQLVRDEVDLSISFGPLFYSRYSAVDVTVSIILDDISIMVPYPKAINSAGSYLTGAFSPMTQVFLYVSFGLVPIALWIVALITKKGEQDLGVIFMFIAAVALGQGGYLRQYGHYSFAIRLIHGSWLIALLVITYAFSGQLISIITTPKFDFIVRSIEDVAANQDIQPLIVNESSTQAEFEDSSNPIFQAIFNRVKENPNKLLVPSSSEFVDLLLTEPNQVLIMSGMLADSEIQEDYRNNKVCRATLLPKVVKSTANSLYLRKDSQYTLALNKELLLLRQAGLSEYLDGTFGQYSSRCYIDQKSMTGGSKQNGPSSPLSLYNLRGVFYTIGYLLLICFVVFVCEFMWHCYRQV
ncbi:hypothetical protein DAPPUDRAFT_107033 [Daphnia pulex]|uniref:Ionotropic glutamate receptor L-glutamate and glycine-binding domain-containing protein n=1 Tax=Daphnia pulex TaxID=6669 RepID=E9GVR5_DAPPU|nr:hypothetical protein DAPPUDRAFT_107033 [Daphnia pulex]|eukprot:EFX76456.1 hypothetical protein DAPPUDRAFT_107033 [Daphnia pulex]